MARTDPDDDALSWAGDDDVTLAPGWKRVGAAVPLTGENAIGETSTGETSTGETDTDAINTDATGADEASDAPTATEAAAEADGGADAKPQLGSVELVVLGILGGVYLLYTVGWLLTVMRTQLPGESIIGDAMYGFGLWVSVLAPALWFALVLAIVRRPNLRIVWLVVGAVVLVPLPFVLGIAV